MSNRSGKLGWFLGLVFGALFGVLFAPGKGKDLRNRMKAERKKGKLGIAPLQNDFKSLGKEVAAIAKDLYESDTVQSLVETGRKRLHEMSDDWVEDVHDFHTKRIVPFTEEVLGEGKKTMRKADAEWKDLKGKVKTSVKIGKKAAKDITGTIKKKRS